jgi:glycosyltransferase involved in cell wall biosynthesis
VNIFIAATSLLPRYGGPAYSVARLATALGQAGVQVGLWAADQSAEQTPLLTACESVRPLIGEATAALNCFGTCDVLHDNGIWMPHNHRLAVLAARHRIPRVVSTRGMLEPWAIRHKGLKKNIAWWLYQRRDLQRAQLLHTTADREATHLARLKLDVPHCTIANGVDLPDIGDVKTCRRRKPSSNGEPRTALFLGRIYPVKGLPMLIEAWNQVRPAGWCLQIVGPDEAGHRRELERAVSRAVLSEVVTFRGPLEGDAKTAAYLQSDLFILPSYSESFGMAAAEALAHGLPVLTTTGTPWQGLAEHGCGWSVEPTAEAIAQGLRTATSQTRQVLSVMGTKGRAWVAGQFSWEQVAKQFIAAYEQLLT